MTITDGVIRVLVVDDHEVVRQGVITTLQRSSDILVVGEAGNAEEAVAAARRTEPHVVVMDLKLPDASGIEATREIRAEHPDARVLMFSSFADDEGVFASLMAGASGYVLKNIRTERLVAAIYRVRRGESLLDPAVTEVVIEHLRASATRGGGSDDRLTTLSAQEERVLTLVADGMTNRQIGERLYLSDKTVKNYVSSILAKLDVARRAEAAAYLAARRSRVVP